MGARGFVRVCLAAAFCPCASRLGPVVLDVDFLQVGELLYQPGFQCAEVAAVPLLPAAFWDERVGVDGLLGGVDEYGCRADDSGWCGAGTFSGGPGGPGRRPDQALRDRPVGLVRSLLQIRQTLGPGDVDVEVLDVDVDLVRRRGQRLRSPDCPG